ncbi:MAG TPA: protein kinase [Verrucomicrobiae bacterium]|jgi:serine/threonine protein kinase/WD40 repeat protein
MPETRKCPACGLELAGEDLSACCPHCASSRGPDAGAPGDVIGAEATAAVALHATEKPGDRIGRFKLLQEIGEGTFGSVYMAEQEEPVRRRVALKILKLGMDTKEVITRFEAERQALAMMDHPNIAKVLDAGSTVSGRPYFVMELVKGERITDYCDKNSLATPGRLDLFIKVCYAIQHAHQKGIIHRDIKPSNILVTLHDGVPVPKVIDFGIAKATHGKLTNRTLFTAYEQFIGTPAYMSPEQAEMSGLDIDTRSDIYSLGVVLYELLAGRTPFDPKEFMASGLDAIRKTIREYDPVRPSTRVATLTGEELTIMAKDRSTDTARLMSQLKGDLDWIVMRCLEKDRTRRYATANELAMDVLRHMNHEPVVARPPSRTYRLQKAFRRHKLVVSAVAAVAAVLVLGVIGTTLGLLRAEKQRQDAEEARVKEREQADIARRSLKAEQEQRARAESEELAARRNAYNSDMNLAQQALAANNLGRAQRLLERQRPKPVQQDLRGWEWRYLWSQTRGDEHEVLLEGAGRTSSPLAFSADGWLLARDTGTEVVMTDLISRKEVLRRPRARRPVFAHRGAVLAFVDESGGASGIALLDVNSQKEKRIETRLHTVRWIGFTPDDHRLLTVSTNISGAPEGRACELGSWDVETGRQLWQRGLGAYSTGNGRPYAISPDGASFAAVQPDGKVAILEVEGGHTRLVIQATEESSIAVMFSPDSATLLTGAGYTDSAIRLWDAHTGKAGGSLAGHRSWVSDLLFSADGKRLISSSGDQTIRLWDWPSLKPAGVLRGHLDEVDGLAVDPDGRTLASRCKDGSIYLWDLNKPARDRGYRTFPCRVSGLNTKFTPDGEALRAVDLKGGVALWDTSTLKEARRLWADSTNGLATMVSPDGQWILQQEDRRLTIWNESDKTKSVKTIDFPSSFSAWFTANGKFLLTLYSPGGGGHLEVWDADTWQRKSQMNTNAEGVFITSIPNSFVIMTFSSLKLFDATRLDKPPVEFDGQGDALDAAASPDGRLFVAAYEDGAVRFWNMTAREPMDTLKGFLLAATSVAFSPDGSRLAVGSSGAEAIKLWDTQTWQEVLTLSGEGSGFNDLQFSPDGRCLLGVNEAGLPHIWSAPTWAEISAGKPSEKGTARR